MTAQKATTNVTERLTVTLDASDRVELDRLSKEMDRSLGWLVRQAIRQYLKKARERAQGRA